MDFKALFDKACAFFSVQSAVGHWWYQRVTALALVPLSCWLLILLNKALTAPFAETAAWLSSPLNAAAILAWTLAVVYHAALGVQVVLEDYVSTLTLRTLAIRVTNLIFAALGLIAILAMFRILIG